MKPRFQFTLPMGLIRGETLNTAHQLTLLELSNRHAPDGTQAKIAEILTKENPILQDAPFQEANNTTHNEIVRRYSIPKGEKRMINAGVGVGASRTKPVNEPCCMIEQYSEPDKKLVNMAANPKAFRMSEARAFIEGIGQTMADLVFYGNHLTNPLDFTGLAPRLASLNPFVLDHTGTGNDLTSIYVVQWNPDLVYMHYPKGHPASGIVNHDDLGEDTAIDGNGKRYQIYRDHFHTDLGLSVVDPRGIGRIANIEETATFNEDLLIELLNKMPRGGTGATIYVNQAIKTRMDIRLKDKTNVYYTEANGFGGPILKFRGHPVHMCEAILQTESQVA